jgi:hypothetical protein
MPFEGFRSVNYISLAPRLLLFAAALFVCAPSHAEVLGPGYAMTLGERLYSADEAYFAMLEINGNFSIFRSSDGARAWSAGTSGSGAAFASMQRDGKLILASTDGSVVWSTPTYGRHRVFGVTTWGTAMIIDARKWKPRKKRAEPIVEQMLRRGGRIHWQSNSFERAPKYRQR